LIERDWYRLGAWNLDAAGRCRFCATPLPGRLETHPGIWGPKRQPVRLTAMG
jgi:pyruvate formate lyase activating enzyme